MKKHSPDLVSLIFGLVFALVAALWPLWHFDVLDAEGLTWVPATALILIGLLGLAISIGKARSASPDRESGHDDLGYEDDAEDGSWRSELDEATLTEAPRADTDLR